LDFGGEFRFPRNLLNKLRASRGGYVRVSGRAIGVPCGENR